MANKKVNLPKGFSVIGGMADGWNFKKVRSLQGTVGEIKSSPSKFKKGEVTKRISITKGDGTVVTVFERAGLKALFDVKKGKEVFISYDGPVKIAGRKKPMESFTVAVKK